MPNKLAILFLKERAIIAAFDELAVIHITGHPTIPVLQAVLIALYGYPNRDLDTQCMPDAIVADNTTHMAIGLLESCIKNKMPQNAIYIIGQLLGIALEHIQAAITRQTTKH
ncbi:hypothetical protein [Chitinophaga polysaccharea]|uniref:hypothetical protein n=1 Tax=Chitinophaga polysaccharea TaxID=1293035 RepID=UPI0011582F54|nr:hypothetical protein [Chitinophaga polysaccharea]